MILRQPITTEFLYLKAKEQYKQGERYKLGVWSSKGTAQEFNVEFEFVGLVGDNKLFQFKAIPGGWTLTLSPLQIAGFKKVRGKYE